MEAAGASAGQLSRLNAWAGASTSYARVWLIGGPQLSGLEYSGRSMRLVILVGLIATTEVFLFSFAAITVQRTANGTYTRSKIQAASNHECDPD